ncbi:MGDG synthase family glycosyltransferase [Acetobacterium wieringae]|uniref:Processive diacylglycerol beta-glucosyltransferase n=1 Tax=Acetobacterium wieringae TaxID=52694 RepID=A0A1F2PFK8_9FIRM|nr:glycosyltransferase [Acetobacterium wieringae]MEA4805150.1 glycosyltransferase [Acetobacterium wieringae]OFV69632.1 processive diacylglycerol beta-glucosyltransferase [Acetobacterium wieringae]URN85813.1 glycosyltransferase [Acetobacterium wieringae]
MLEPKRILILTCSHGSGHKMVAQTLKESFEARGHLVSVEDLFDKTNPTLNRMIEKSYLLSYSIGSSFYERVYYDVEEYAHNKLMYNLWNFTSKALLKMVDAFKPDCIINTYGYTISAILKKDNYPHIKLFTVVTDFCIPKPWIHQETDRYYVACENVEETLIGESIPRERILKTGIPIRDAFYARENRQAILKKYNLNPHKKILIIFAGTYGVLKNIKEICQRTDRMNNLQTIVICGKNQHLQRELEMENLQNTRIFGFVPDIHEFYTAGDLMVTKPGGITLSEVVAKKIPVILYNPTPGQEGENACWFKRQGAAVVANNFNELILAIDALKENEIKRFSIKNSLSKIYYGHAANLITQDVLTQLTLADGVPYLTESI